MLVHPALVTAVLGRVDRRHERSPEAPGEVVAGGGDEPVVAVDEIEVEAVAELHPGGEHVGVHPLDPGDELAEVARAGRLENAMDVDPVGDLGSRGLLAAAGQHVHLDPEIDQALGELADVPGQAAFDQRRVLPGKDEDSAQVKGLRRLKVRAVAPGRGPARGCASSIRPTRRILWPRTAPASGRAALIGVIAGLAAVVEERPVARLHARAAPGRP